MNQQINQETNNLILELESIYSIIGIIGEDNVLNLKKKSTENEKKNQLGTSIFHEISNECNFFQHLFFQRLRNFFKKNNCLHFSQIQLVSDNFSIQRNNQSLNSQENEIIDKRISDYLRKVAERLIQLKNDLTRFEFKDNDQYEVIEYLEERDLIFMINEIIKENYWRIKLFINSDQIVKRAGIFGKMLSFFETKTKAQEQIDNFIGRIISQSYYSVKIDRLLYHDAYFGKLSDLQVENIIQNTIENEEAIQSISKAKINQKVYFESPFGVLNYKDSKGNQMKIWLNYTKWDH